MDVLLAVPLLAAAVVLTVFLIAFPWLVLLWLYDIRRATRRQAELMERMGHAEGWLPSAPPKR